MNILLSSHSFHPAIGGVEEVSKTLAREFVAAGHNVRVVTRTASEDATPFTFEVYRRPTPAKLTGLLRWSDVLLQNNISLRTAWPLLLAAKPWVIAHHTWIRRTDGRVSWRDRLKQFLTRRARNIAVSSAVASHLTAPATVIGNPYRDDVFQRDCAAVRDLDLIYVGRLASEKGVDLLLEALSGLSLRLTVVGVGPEEAALRRQCDRLGLTARVNFAGARSGPELAHLLNRHRVIAIPSRAEETFGLAAIEGIACGCVPVGARGGGLCEAIGPCGATFERGNSADLARVLSDLWRVDLTPFLAAAPAHLSRFTARNATAEYLKILEASIR